METMPIAIIFALALLVEGLTEYFLADLLQVLKLPASFLKLMAAGMGVALCLVYEVDALALFFGLSPRWAPLGEVLTGLMLGRGANFLHDLYSRYGRQGWRG